MKTKIAHNSLLTCFPGLFCTPKTPRHTKVMVTRKAPKLGFHIYPWRKEDVRRGSMRMLRGKVAPALSSRVGVRPQTSGTERSGRDQGRKLLVGRLNPGVLPRRSFWVLGWSTRWCGKSSLWLLSPQLYHGARNWLWGNLTPISESGDSSFASLVGLRNFSAGLRLVPASFCSTLVWPTCSHPPQPRPPSLCMTGLPVCSDWPKVAALRSMWVLAPTRYLPWSGRRQVRYKKGQFPATNNSLHGFCVPGS